MRKIAVLAGLSLRYWRRHWKRFLTLAFVCILSAAALGFSALYVRSEKAFTLERRLDRQGDYDAIFYGMEEQELPLITENERLSACGFYRELGYVCTDDGGQYKLASFSDENSERIYHMSCIRGSYPRKAGEIAIDAGIAKRMGIVPIPGEKAELALCNMDGETLGEREFVVSGIFEASSEEVVGGFYRYPQSQLSEEYFVPALFAAEEDAGLFGSTLVTAFFQTQGDSARIALQIADSGIHTLIGYDISLGRTDAQSALLGILDHISSGYGEITAAALLDAVRDGNVWKDFYSSVLIPLFAALILVIAAVSVFGLVRNLILERSEEIAILRSVGMTKQGVFVYLFAELVVLDGFFLLAGGLLGYGLHFCLIRCMNALSGAQMPFGFSVNSYVASVTPDPWRYTLCVVGLGSLAAACPALFRMAKSTPIAVFQKRYLKMKSRMSRHFSEFKACGWHKVVGRQIRFSDRFVPLIMCVVMCAAFFGYNYFRALADKNSAEYRNSLSESGLGEWDFAAVKGDWAQLSSFQAENHHNYGIAQEAYRKFAGTSYIEESFARMVNRSTRLAVSGEEREKLREVFEPFSLRQYEAFEDSEDDYERTEYEAEKAMMEAYGYGAEEDVYALPTIGVDWEELSELSPCVKEGALDPEKLKDGSEAALVLPADLAEEAGELFHAGDVLPLSDILLSEEEDRYDFGTPFDYTEPVYLRYVKEPGGATVRYASFAYGSRKEIDPRIGAIIVLEDEELLEKYTLSGLEAASFSDDANRRAPSVLCLPKAFAAWGLPDALFTDVRFSLEEGANPAKADEQFYRMLSGCEGVSFASSYEIREQMELGMRNTMTVYYVMIVMLICTGILAIGIKFYSQIRLRTQTISRLRAIGMSLPQLIGMILRQNAVCPLVCGGLAVIPTALCQLFFLFIRRQIDSGAWAGISTEGLPWYHNVPFRYDLFGYHPVAVLLVIVALFELLIVLATVPQIRYMKKQVIAETIDMDSF